MAVHLGEVTVGVTDPVADLRQRHARRRAVGHERVAQIVESDPVRARSLHRWQVDTIGLVIVASGLALRGYSARRVS